MRGETTEVRTEDLDMLLEYAIAEFNFANPEQPEITEAVFSLFADRHDCYLCELCTTPRAAPYRAGPEMAVCGTHANELEAGRWNDEEWEIEPIEP